MTAKRFSCPERLLAEEIEFAIMYTVACNRGRRDELLLSPPDGCRAEFAKMVVATLLERAEKGLSGMSLADDTPGKA